LADATHGGHLDDQQRFVPPDELIREHSGGITAEQFVAMGDEIFKSFIDHFKLEPHHAFLDIGCGCGKVTRPLAGYLNALGSYNGIDITARVIEWCRQTYREYPNFRFHLADVYSTRYNRRGGRKASEYRFPVADGTQDMVFLSSVFTHMIPEDVDHYLNEIARVMKPGAVCRATYFLLDAESRANNAAGLTTPKFSFPFGSDGCLIEVEDIPEAAIAYDEGFIAGLYAKYGLTSRTYHGEWGRSRFIGNWQDEIVAVKE
jgi:SAM-dependent methyltransferase